MATVEIPFPASIPDIYPIVKDEPVFDPAVHLALEKPTNTVALETFGYDQDVTREAPTNMAVAGPLRILSDEGVSVMRASARAFRRPQCPH